jgi:hypothetical protein
MCVRSVRLTDVLKRQSLCFEAPTQKKEHILTSGILLVSSQPPRLNEKLIHNRISHGFQTVSDAQGDILNNVPHFL